MSSRFSAHRLLGTTSMLALSAGAILATAMIQPAAAATPSGGLWGGGSSLSSLTLRQVFDCYKGAQVSGDGYTPSSSFTSSPPSPGLLPSACSSAASRSAVEGLFAAVGSGRGQQAFISHDALQLLNGGAVPAAGLPALPPNFIDTASGSTNFNTYPYPGLTFAASDNPLPATLTTSAFTFTGLSTTGWATSNTSGSVSIGTAVSVSYDSTNFGPAIQLPLFEVPVAIAVNTNGLDQLLSAAATPANAGGAIQLSTAQVCAIFSGTVTDWNSTATITALDSTGAQTTQLFYADNVSTTAATSTANTKPYASSSTPIRVTYRADGSGTSFIFTNYLKASCLPLATTANKYASIFGATGLPSTSFSTLASAVTAAGNSVANWQSATGSSGVATAIGTASGSTTSGAIGYLSADFTTPYANSSVISGAPHSASVQNEAQRAAGVNHPYNQSTNTSTPFITPTPASADAAYSALTANATIPSTGTYADWNLYNYTYTSGSLSGKSILGIPNTTGAYPVAGTTFLDTYSCLANAATNVTGFLSWYYNAGGTAANSTVNSVLENNGFHALNSSGTQNLAATIYNQYLNSTSSTRISPTSGGSTACSGKTGA
ncbi:substrate-binding domain-containing protein [Telmatospirillum siberiense]|uniref:Ig-like domain-containing protein n=1 Tax=Telmatospirillum siberiense TaxID=382514 RepID=A0A2N3PMA3_9PROT|nr:substrate-binding domain-containing protein [Telmatospirillum siberiense]PKU21538.1 hypothetical protein CWS72_26250 [Telmatospirillum siberiense]